VEKGILQALSAVLKMKEARILAVSLEGIEKCSQGRKRILCWCKSKFIKLIICL